MATVPPHVLLRESPKIGNENLSSDDASLMAQFCDAEHVDCSTMVFCNIRYKFGSGLYHHEYGESPVWPLAVGYGRGSPHHNLESTYLVLAPVLYTLLRVLTAESLSPRSVS